MEREEEKERRRLRDRQRRESMTEEQRERHLARRRRNYQLRRQRAANAPFIPLPQPQPQPPSNGEATTGEWITPSTSSGYRVLYHGLNQGQVTDIVEGSSIQLEGLPRRLRLNNIKRLARNLISSMSDDTTGNHQAAELMAKGDVSGGDGSKPKPLRLNRVKRLARSISSPSKETAAQKNHNGTVEVNKMMEKGESIRVARASSKIT